MSALEGVKTPNPTAAQESFEPGTRDEEAADGTTNAEFPAQLAGGGLGEAQEVTKFPIVQAIALAGHVRAVGNDGLDDVIKGEFCHGSGVINLA